MITILSFIALIGILVFVHELGHFLAAKSVGVRVEKFYLGFNFFGLGWKKIYNGTEYGIGLFPLGGYVKVAGIIDESMDSEFVGKPDEFCSKNMFQKIWIMSAGVIMNFLLAIIIFSHLTYYNGIDEPSDKAIIGEVSQGYPAELIGLQKNDQIIAINNIEIHNWNEMAVEINSRPKEKILIRWLRNKNQMESYVTTVISPSLPWEKDNIKGMIGIQPLFNKKDVSILEAYFNGCKQTYQWLYLTYKSLIATITGDVSLKDLAGPIMIAKIAGETASSEGVNAFLGLMALISINLGLINILPIPGLDGGHILIALIEGIIRRDLPLKIKLGIQQFGLLLILMIFIIIMINDIQRLF